MSSRCFSSLAGTQVPSLCTRALRLAPPKPKSSMELCPFPGPAHTQAPTQAFRCWAEWGAARCETKEPRSTSFLSTCPWAPVMAQGKEQGHGAQRKNLGHGSLPNSASYCLLGNTSKSLRPKPQFPHV